MNDNIKIGCGIALIVTGLIAFLILNPLVKIDAGERGVVLAWGAVTDEILDEGIHWIAPIKNKIVRMNVQIQREERGASASSKDLQVVSTKITLNYRLDALKVNKLYQDLRKDYTYRVVEPAIAEYLKKTTAKFTAEELITKREEVKNMLREAVAENLAVHNIIVVDIFITDFDYSDEFNNAIEQKVRAEQEALMELNILEKVKAQAEQRITTAKAEAEAIRIQAQAITQQGGKDYVQLKAIEKWDGVLPGHMIPGGAVPFLNLNN